MIWEFIKITKNSFLLGSCRHVPDPVFGKENSRLPIDQLFRHLDTMPKYPQQAPKPPPISSSFSNHRNSIKNSEKKNCMQRLKHYKPLVFGFKVLFKKRTIEVKATSSKILKFSPRIRKAHARLLDVILDKEGHEEQNHFHSAGNLINHNSTLTAIVNMNCLYICK